MARVQRIDLHRLDGPEVLPSGDLRVPARVARVGVLRYADAQGNTWGELVPESTLFDPASMATLRGVAATDLHPAKPVTPATRKGLQVGHVGDLVERDGDFLAAPVYVTDADAIRLVQSGQRRDVSCGYECELDETPGIHNGEPYDRVQRSRVYNHLGLGPAGWGRAGTDVSLRLDGGDETVARSLEGVAVARLDSRDSRESTPTASTTSTGREPTTRPSTGQGNHMAQKTTKRDGDEMLPKDAEKDTKDMGGEAKKIDSPDLAAQLDAANAALMEAMKTCAALKAQLVVAESTKMPEVTEEMVPEAVADSIVSKRLATLDAARSDARTIAPEAKIDGLLSPRKIHEAAIKAVSPEMKLDGLSDDRVAGMFDALKVGAEKAKKAEKVDGKSDRSARNDGLANAHRAAAGEPGEKTGDTVEDAIRKMHQDCRDDWRNAAPALRVSTTIKAD